MLLLPPEIKKVKGERGEQKEAGEDQAATWPLGLRLRAWVGMGLGGTKSAPVSKGGMEGHSESPPPPKLRAPVGPGWQESGRLRVGAVT